MTTKLLRRSDVMARTGLPTSTLYEKIAKGEFPRPVSLGARSVAWRESEIEDWIESRRPVGEANAE
jgi:prophage regulatory protein